MSQPLPPRTNATEQTFSSTEVAYHLQVTAETLRGWNRRFGRYLSAPANGDEPRFYDC